MQYQEVALISVTVLACVHLFAGKIPVNARFLSLGGGVAIAYMFVDLLPKLAHSDQVVTQALEGIFPYFEQHVYVMALVGFLLFFVVNQSHAILRQKEAFWLSLGSYALFNFLVGYAVVDKDDPEVRPLALFTFAMALHYFVNDYSLSTEHAKEYGTRERWVLVVSLYFGWLAGAWMIISPAAIALVTAFIAGGVILNVTRHELPADKPHSLGAFVLAALVYTAILLCIG